MAARPQAPPPRCYATGRARLSWTTTTPKHPALQGLQLPAGRTRRRRPAGTTSPGRLRGQGPIGRAGTAGCAAGGERGKRRGDISCRATPGAAARAGPRMAALGGRCGAREGVLVKGIGAWVVRGVWRWGGDEGVGPVLGGAPCEGARAGRGSWSGGGARVWEVERGCVARRCVRLCCVRVERGCPIRDPRVWEGGAAGRGERGW